MTEVFIDNVWVCTDCFYAAECGVFRAAVFADGTSILWDDEDNVPPGATLQWFAGDTDSPADREPLGRLDEYRVADNTCSNHDYSNGPCPHCGNDDDENGIHEFSWRRCEGCGSRLGGSRYRMSLWKKNA
jgi:hypothetical protein